MKAPRVTLTRHADFADMLGGLRLIAASIGPARGACLLAVDADDQESPFARDEQPGWASFPRTRAERPYKVVAFQHDGTHFTRTEIPEVPFPVGMGPMTDCYALNVADDATWACYYTGFPVVRVSPDRTRQAWTNPFPGVQALAVSRDRVLLWGGYQEERNRCVVQRLGAGSLTHPRHITLLLPDGGPLSNGTIVGRGSILHAIVGTCWYQLDLNELP